MHIRHARPGDAEAIARIHTESGRDAYRGILPDEVIDGDDRLTVRRAGWNRILDRIGFETAPASGEAAWVTVDGDGDVIGLVHVCASTDEDALPESGEITTFYVATAQQRQGVGSRLLITAVDHLLDHGFSDLRLWTLEGNERAQRFYAARGWAADGAVRAVHVPDYEADEIRMRRGGTPA